MEGVRITLGMSIIIDCASVIKNLSNSQKKYKLLSYNNDLNPNSQPTPSQRNIGKSREEVGGKNQDANGGITLRFNVHKNIYFTKIWNDHSYQ